MTQDLIRDDRYLCPKCGKSNEWQPRDSYRWVDVVVIVGLALLIGAGLEKWEAEHHVYRFENVKVTKKYDAYRYRMKFASGEYAVWFCKNYKPCIPEGSILTSLRYEDEGDCWDIKPAGLGYNFLQNENGDSIDENGKVVFDAVRDSCQ